MRFQKVMNMDLSNVRDKLAEASFFFHHLRQEQDKTTLQRQGDGFRYYFSAFLNACFSVFEYLEREAKAALKAGASAKQQSNKQAKGRYTEWFSQWIKHLSPGDLAVWSFMTENRGAEVHTSRVETTKEMKAVPADDWSHSTRNPYFTYYYRAPALYAAIAAAGNEIGDPLLEEKKKLGLPSWCNAWTYLDTHYVEIDGERVRVVEISEKYLVLLDKLIRDFEQADLN